MRTTIIAMLHQGHTSADKMDRLAEAFWWPGMHREIQGKAETCPSWRAGGKNTLTQFLSTEKKNLEILIEPNQEFQLDFAGPIKSKTRGDVYILVAIDRFSKWPTAQVCKNTDTRTVLKFWTKDFADHGTPRCIRTENGSCIKSNEVWKFCDNEDIKRIKCTPNLHTGTGLVERTIRTIKSLTRANMADGLIFEDSVQLAIKTIRQTPHSRLNMTPFQMHLGRQPRTALTNLIGKSECLLSKWKRTITNYISAQPTELQVFTISDSEGEMVDYLVLNDTRKRGRSVSQDFKKYQFYEKENKLNSMKSGFKTNEILTPIKETDHTVTTPEGKIIRKKLASKPLKFQTSKRTDEQKRTINRCRRCGKFSNDDDCETHRRLNIGDSKNNNADDVPGTSYTHRKCRWERSQATTAWSYMTPPAETPTRLLQTRIWTAQTRSATPKKLIWEPRWDEKSRSCGPRLRRWRHQSSAAPRKLPTRRNLTNQVPRYADRKPIPPQRNRNQQVNQGQN